MTETMQTVEIPWKQTGQSPFCKKISAQRDICRPDFVAVEFYWPLPNAPEAKSFQGGMLDVAVINGVILDRFSRLPPRVLETVKRVLQVAEWPDKKGAIDEQAMDRR